MGIDVKAIENAFEWESFEDGKPYLGTYKQQIPNRVKMMTQKLDLKDWVKIDRTYASQQQEKQRLLDTLRDEVFVTNNDHSTTMAKRELFETLCKYLPERFPDKFEARQEGVYNKMLQEFISTSDQPGEEDPLIKCGRLTQEDWCIMEWNEEHQAYCLTAGIVCFPSLWSLREKWKLPMMGIHQPVEGFTKHLTTLVNNIFKTMSPDAPLYRGNWSISGDLNGPLDLYLPETRECLNAAKGGVRSYEGERTGRVLTFRCEYQTLRKLEKSKAIVFSIRTYQMYLEEFKKFPREDAEMLIKAINNIHPDFIQYKGVHAWKDATIEYLRRDVLGERETLKTPWIINSWKTSSVLVVGGSALVLMLTLTLMKR